jgi:hypothetical protein
VSQEYLDGLFAVFSVPSSRNLLRRHLIEGLFNSTEAEVFPYSSWDTLSGFGKNLLGFLLTHLTFRGWVRVLLAFPGAWGLITMKSMEYLKPSRGGLPVAPSREILFSSSTTC